MTTKPMTMTTDQHRNVVGMFFANVIDNVKTHEYWKKTDAVELLIGAIEEVQKMSPEQWALLRKDLQDRYVGR